MATIPPEDQELLDSLSKAMIDLHAQEVEAAHNGNDVLQRSVHHELTLIHSVIKSVIKYHVDRQNK